MRALALFLVLFVLLRVTPIIEAAGEFKADYDVTYAVDQNGTTTVTQNITLTNQHTNLYPQQYQLVIDSTKVSRIIAYDGSGAITPVVSVSDDGKTEILLTFNERVVGQGKQLRFTLRYENGEIAQKIGSIWEVTVPGVVDDPDLVSYVVSLQVPPSFGTTAYLSPRPSSGNRWTKEQMVQGGVSAAYGSEQRFIIDISYALDNPNVAPTITEIALPPDTAYQKIAIESIAPKPKSITRDSDGNWLARYELNAGGSLDVEVRILAAISLIKREGFQDEMKQENEYIKPLKYWETQNPTIQELSRQYTTPRQIYDYVVKTLSYSYDRVNENPVRLGAVEALARPDRAICMEFTDVFIALARAAGIPARENVGFAYTTNAKLRPLSLVTDVLHAWPEYYDREIGTWIPVDPTWANTTGGVNYFDKLDFNHIVFAIHGIESDYPYPAGFYRREGKTGKDVRISFAESQETVLVGNLVADIQFPERITAGLPARGTVVIRNDSGIAADEAIIDIVGIPGNLSLTRIERNLPPFASVRIPVALDVPHSIANTQGAISVSVNGTETRKNFDVRPLYWLVVPASIGIGGIIIIIWAIVRQNVWKRLRVR